MKLISTDNEHRTEMTNAGVQAEEHNYLRVVNVFLNLDVVRWDPGGAG